MSACVRTIIFCLVAAFPTLISDGEVEETAPTGPSGGEGLRVNGNRNLAINQRSQISREIFGLYGWKARNSREIRDRIAAVDPGLLRVYPDMFGLGWEDPKTPGHFDPRVFDYDNAGWAGQYLKHFDWIPKTLVESELQQRLVLLVSSMPPWLVRDPETRTRWKWNGVPQDIGVWTAWVEGYVEMFQRNPLHPTVRSPYVEILNEPDTFDYFGDHEIAADPTNPFPNVNGEVAAEKYCRLFNAAAGAIKRRWPEAQVGGPALAHGLVWAGNITWRQWMPIFMKNCAWTADFFAVHWYGHFRDPDDLDLKNPRMAGYDHNTMQLELNAFHNHQLLTRGRALPMMVTEHSVHLQASTEDNRVRMLQKRMLWVARVLFSMIEDPDKLAGMTYHYTGTVGSDGFGLFETTGDPRPDYWLYHLFRRLKGQRLVVQGSKGPLRSIAALNRDSMNIVVFNDSEKESVVPIVVDAPQGTAIVGVELERLNLDNRNTVAYQSEEAPPPPGVTSWKTDEQLPPFGLIAVHLRLDQPAATGERTDLKDFFGDQVMADLPTEVIVRIPKGVVPQSAVIRLGLQQAVGQSIRVMLNGRLVHTLPSDRHTGGSNSDIVKIPIETTPKTGENLLYLEVEGKAKKPIPRLAFAALRVSY